MYYEREFEEEFQSLQTEIIEAYEADLEDRRSVSEARQKQARQTESETREILREAEIDIDRLEKLSEAEADEARERQDALRMKSIERAPVGTARLASPDEEAAIVCETGGSVVQPYAATILAPEMAWLEGIAGEKGNPWIRPHNPGQLNLMNEDVGGNGWGCAAQGGFPRTRGYVWYRFHPNKNGTWNVRPRIDFNGFYRYHANDKFYNCKRASVRLDVDVFVNQYGRWRTDRAEYTLISKGGKNVDNYAHKDNAYAFPLTLELRADPCWVLARLTLDADARGKGSWAELNFKDGAANYIKPWYLVAKKI